MGGTEDGTEHEHEHEHKSDEASGGEFMGQERILGICFYFINNFKFILQCYCYCIYGLINIHLCLK